MGFSGANPYLARALTKDLVRQHKIAQANEASAERARLDASEVRELALERQLEGQPTAVDRRRGLLDRLRRRSA